MPTRHMATAATNHKSDDDAETEHAVDHVVSREAGAAALRRLADGIATGGVELTDDDAVTVAVPDRFELEIEYEEDDNEAELEGEVEWPLVDALPESVEPSEESDAVDEVDADTTEAVDAEDSDGVDDSDAAAASAAETVAIAAPGSKARFELFRDRATEWRWRLVHDNGNIITDSGEGYSRKAAARKGLESVMRNAAGVRVVEDD